MKTLALVQTLAQDKPGGSGIEMFLMLGILFVVMWVVMIRPQQKRQKELQKKINSLKKTDKVVTIGGIHGVINHVGKETISLRVADGYFMTFDKKAVATVLTDKKDEEEEASDKEPEKEDK